MRVGVLALQGDVREHRRALSDLGATVSGVRTPEDLESVDAIVLPGGESTAISHLLRTSGLAAPLAERLRDGMPAFGTCAGLVLLASRITDGRDDQLAMGLLDVTVQRNGYGRQVASFESHADVDGIGIVPTVFIRAPRIIEAGADVDVLATIDTGDGAHPVVVRSGAVLATAFHPELTDDRRLHEAFLELAASPAAVSQH